MLDELNLRRSLDKANEAIRAGEASKMFKDHEKSLHQKRGMIDVGESEGEAEEEKEAEKGEEAEEELGVEEGEEEGQRTQRNDSNGKGKKKLRISVSTENTACISTVRSGVSSPRQIDSVERTTATRPRSA